MFSDEQLRFIKKASKLGLHGEVVEVYGSISEHSVYRARPKYRISNLSLLELEKYISKLHEMGIVFNYTLNSSSLGNLAQNQNSFKKIVELAGKLIKIGVDKFTVSLPLVAKAIREVSKTIPLEVSTIAQVSSISQIVTWKEMYGVNSVCLGISSNRDIGLLSAMSKYSSKSGVGLYLNIWTNVTKQSIRWLIQTAVGGTPNSCLYFGA